MQLSLSFIIDTFNPIEKVSIHYSQEQITQLTPFQLGWNVAQCFAVLESRYSNAAGRTLIGIFIFKSEQCEQKAWASRLAG